MVLGAWRRASQSANSNRLFTTLVGRRFSVVKRTFWGFFVVFERNGTRASVILAEAEYDVRWLARVGGLRELRPLHLPFSCQAAREPLPSSPAPWNWASKNSRFCFV